MEFTISNCTFSLDENAMLFQYHYMIMERERQTKMVKLVKRYSKENNVPIETVKESDLVHMLDMNDLNYDNFIKSVFTKKIFTEQNTTQEDKDILYELVVMKFSEILHAKLKVARDEAGSN